MEVTRLRRGIFVARHGERVDYRWKATGRNWTAQADRPWDSPLTPGGWAQGTALGESINEHCARLSLAPVRVVIASPLVRCVQTAAAAAGPLGVKRVAIDPSLVESMCEDWYRSWSIPGANGTWGAQREVHPQASDVHPIAREPASVCHSAPADIDPSIVTHPSTGEVAVEIDEDYIPKFAGSFSYCWGNFETYEDMDRRMLHIAEEVWKVAFECSVLLVSHGGPTTELYGTLTRSAERPFTGYTGLYCYERTEEDTKNAEDDSTPSQWNALVVADHDHLNKVPTADTGGPNDLLEQRR